MPTDTCAMGRPHSLHEGRNVWPLRLSPPFQEQRWHAAPATAWMNHRVVGTGVIFIFFCKWSLFSLLFLKPEKEITKKKKCVLLLISSLLFFTWKIHFFWTQTEEQLKKEICLNYCWIKHPVKHLWALQLFPWVSPTPSDFGVVADQSRW